MSDGTYVELGIDAINAKKTVLANKDIQQVFTDTQNGIELTELVHITTDGQIQHTVTVKNVGDHDLSNVNFGTMLDTMLDENDSITLLSSGNGGIYLTDDALTLYAEAMKNASVYAGSWNGADADIYDRRAVSGNYGKILVDDIDSALQYETSKINLAKGQSYVYGYVERLYTNHESIGQVTVHYVDENGNKIQDDTVLGGIVGQGFNVSPVTISGYTYKSVNGNANGTYSKTAQAITFIYVKNGETPVTPDVPEPSNPSQSEQVVPSTSSSRPKAVVNETVYTPEANQTSVKSATLPQTDENDQSISILSLIGLAISGLIASLGLTKKQRKN